jgi:hypothetical protein
VGLPFGFALTVLGLGYSETGQPQEAVGAAGEAAALFRTLDTANPAVRQPLAWALGVLGLGYIQTGQPQEAVGAAGEAAALFRTLDTKTPAVGMLLAFTLTVLGLGYSETGQPQEAVGAVGDAVALLRAMDMSNQPVRQSLAWALMILGQGYSQTGKTQEAVGAAAEAVGIYRDLSGPNPALLPLLADALGNLGDCYLRAGMSGEIDAQWADTVQSRERPADKAFLLVRRAAGREPGDAKAVDELIRAKPLLAATDRAGMAEFHMVCRSHRSADPANFDAMWRQRSGEDPLPWLTLEETTLRMLSQWIRTSPLESSRDFLREHIGALRLESSSAALDEIALTQDDPSLIDPFRNVLERAFTAGVDEAYRPEFALMLLSAWMSSDAATTRKMLQDRRQELLGPDVEEVLRSLLAENPTDPTLLAHQALLELARADREDLAFLAMENPTKASALLLDRARAGDVAALDALSTILSLFQEAVAERALAGFYRAVTLVLRDQSGKAHEAAIMARRLDPSQVPAWLAILVELSSKHNELTTLAQALVTPLPKEEDGEGKGNPLD